MVDSSPEHIVCTPIIHRSKIRSIKKINRKTKVFNFHVPKFESYIANNIVTHNCYVARHRQFGNPLEKYTNKEEIWRAVKSFHQSLGPKTVANQCDPKYWTYDIGESTDCLAPQNVEDTAWYISQFLTTDAKPSFATKVAGAKGLPIVSNRDMARVRVSIAPQYIINQTEAGTSTLVARLKGIQDLYDKGYEVHLNFSPVIAYMGWVKEYQDLFLLIDKTISSKVKDQLKCEVIFLTHSEQLHKSNLEWWPDAETWLWTPIWQEQKVNERGSIALRYDTTGGLKQNLVKRFEEIIKIGLPYCKIRYIF